MTRYWADEAQTEAAMKPDEDGTLWMYTGDEAVMDEEGYVRSMFQIKCVTEEPSH